MVRATGAVAHDAAAELREGHPDHAVLQVEQVQVVLERADRIADTLEQCSVRADGVVPGIGLFGMRVEAVQTDPVHAGLQATADQLRYDLQGLGQLCAGLVPGGIKRALVAALHGRSIDHIAVQVGLALNGAHEIEPLATAVRGDGVHVQAAREVERVLGVVDRHAHAHPHVLQADGDRPPDPDRQRIGHVRVRKSRRIIGELVVEVAPHPTRFQRLVRVRAGLPDVRCPEMGIARVRIAHALHDGELAVVPKVLKPGE